MPASKKRSNTRGNSSAEQNQLQNASTLFGDWVNVWHGVKVQIDPHSPFEKIFPNELKPSGQSKFVFNHLFPKLTILGNTRGLYKDYLYILLNMHWPALLLILAIVNFAFIFIYAMFFCICKNDSEGLAANFLSYFNLSFHTYTSIGFGIIFPMGRCENFVATTEALVSMMTISCLTGLVFAKFAMPRAKIAFSTVCAIQPYGDHHLALVMRVANCTDSQSVTKDVIMDASFRVNLLRIEKKVDDSLGNNGSKTAGQSANNVVLCNYNLKLLQHEFITFRMGVALIHVIDHTSPLHALSYNDLVDSDMIIHVTMSGVDSTLQDTISERFIYTTSCLRWGEKFTEMLRFNELDHSVVMDLSKLSSTESAAIDEATYVCRKNSRRNSRRKVDLKGIEETEKEDDVDSDQVKKVNNSNSDPAEDDTSSDDLTLARRMRSSRHLSRHNSRRLRRFSCDMEPLFEPLLYEHSSCETERLAQGSDSPNRRKLNNALLELISPRTKLHIQSQLNGGFPQDAVETLSSASIDDEFCSHHSFSSVTESQNTPQFNRILPINLPPSSSVLRLYYHALHVKWMPIIFYIVIWFTLINCIFASLYLLEVDGIIINDDLNVTSFEACFFFSVHTISTIGYGSIAPVPDSNYINFLVTMESTLGIVGVTILTGISWSKLARPRAHIRFSKNILFTKLYGHRCLVFRAANIRHSGDICESSFRIGVILTNGITGLRQLYNVPLIVSIWPSFSLCANLVHIIDESSPFFSVNTAEDLSKYRVAVIALFTGLDSTFSESVYAKKMYFYNDFRYNMHFKDITVLNSKSATIDFSEFDSLVCDELEVEDVV